MEILFRTTNTRTYVTEHASLIIGGDSYSGTYKWMNRPWQRYTYQEASIRAIKNAYKDGALTESQYESLYETATSANHLDELVSEVRNA